MNAENPILLRVRQRFRWHVQNPFERRVVSPLRRLRNARRSFTPVFVAGVGGSGTSLLAVVLAQRFACAGLVYESAHDVAESSFLFGPLNHFRDVDDYLRGIAPRPDWSVQQGRADLLDLYRSKARRPGRFVIDKGPDVNLVRAEFLHRCFPDAAFILIFRDPLANVEGFRRKWDLFRNDTLEEAIRFYAETHEAFLRAAEGFADRVVAIEYEQLVEDVDGVLSAAGERLGLPPTAEGLRAPSYANVEGMGLRNARGGKVGIVADTTRRALERLAPQDAEAIRARLGGLHERLRSLPYRV